jgi:hypothetical protein
MNALNNERQQRMSEQTEQPTVWLVWDDHEERGMGAYLNRAEAEALRERCAALYDFGMFRVCEAPLGRPIDPELDQPLVKVDIWETTIQYSDGRVRRAHFQLLEPVAAKLPPIARRIDCGVNGRSHTSAAHADELAQAEWDRYEADLLQRERPIPRG